MTNETQMIEVVFIDGPGPAMWAQLSTLIVPIIGLRSLFLLKVRNSEKAKRSALRCYLWLHIQSAFCLVSGTWSSLSLMFRSLGFRSNEEEALAFQCLNISDLLWVIVWQCSIATLCALVVASCSGFRPSLWQPKYSVASVLLCATAQAIVFGMFEIMRN